MRASARVVAERRGERSRCTTLRSSPPLTFRATPAGLHLVGTVAGPVGADRLTLEVTVAAGASLSLRSVAAQLVLPAPVPAPSTMHVAVTAGPQARLTWMPEPILLVRGADHRLTTTIGLSPGAHLVWRDEVVLGRDGEAAGSLLSRLRVERDGRPLLCTEVALGPAWPTSDGPAGPDGARVVATTQLVGAAARDLLACVEDLAAHGGGCRSAVLCLDDDAVVLTALGPGLDATRALFPPVLVGGQCSATMSKGGG